MALLAVHVHVHAHAAGQRCQAWCCRQLLWQRQLGPAQTMQQRCQAAASTPHAACTLQGFWLGWNPSHLDCRDLSCNEGVH